MKKASRITYSNTCRRKNWCKYLGMVTLECHDKGCPLIMTYDDEKIHVEICAFRIQDRESIAQRLREAGTT